MKRTELKRGTGLARGESTLKRTRIAPRSEKRKGEMAAPDPHLQAAREAWGRETMGDNRCACCGVGGRMQGHHVVYRQTVRKHGGDEWDLRNRLSLHPEHHMAHHHGGRKINQSKLRPENIAFVRDLLGDAAQDYLDRHYPKAPSGH